MKIAVVNEVSACAKNPDVVEALQSLGHEVLNLGMAEGQMEPTLTYMHTALMSAIALNLGIADFVVGGCGTGQGYYNAVLQFPGVTCGLLAEPLDAWLFTRINSGNCASLPLNKGYGWAANVNLKLMFEHLFPENKEGGYPANRVESQAESRAALNRLSLATHLPMEQIVDVIDPALVSTVMQNKAFAAAVAAAAPCALRDKLLAL